MAYNERINVTMVVIFALDITFFFCSLHAVILGNYGFPRSSTPSVITIRFTKLTHYFVYHATKEHFLLLLRCGRTYFPPPPLQQEWFGRLMVLAGRQ